MTSVEAVAAEDEWPELVVEVRVPARVDQLAVVRSAVATIAAGFELTIDAIADAKLAVDEACTTLVRASATGASVECRVGGAPERLIMRCSTTIRGEGPIGQGLSWYVLRSLTTNLSAGSTPLDHDPDMRSAWIEFTIDSAADQAAK